jgi:hypothetical protein
MSILIKGKDFGPTEQVTSTKLDELVDNASFTNTSQNAVAYTGTTGTCLQGGGLEVTSLGQLQIADSGVNTNEISNSSVTTAKIADANVTTAKIANSNVTTDKIANDGVTQAKIANDAVGADQLASNAVVTASIVDSNVTTAKIANDAITTAKIADNVALGGNPTTTTQAAANNSERIATTAYVTSGIANALTGSGGIFGTIDQTADSNPKIFSKNSSGDYDSVAPSGDVAMTQAGAFTIQANAVEGTMLNSNTVDDSSIELSSDTLSIKDGGVTFAKLADATLTSIKESLYPTGSLLTTTVNYADSAAVVAAYGGTTWVRFGAGKVPVGYDSGDTDFDTAEDTGGDKTKSKTIAINEIPNHAHGTPLHNSGMPSNFGTASGTFNNTKIIESTSTNATSYLTTSEVFNGSGAEQTQQAMSLDVVQPYIVVYMWKRTV